MSEHGASYLLYLASDAVVDGCFPVLDALGDEIDELEEAVVGGGGAAPDAPDLCPEAGAGAAPQDREPPAGGL